MIERYKIAKEKLMNVVEEALEHLDCVNAAELGEVVDMIKDFEETMYYCFKIKKMHTEMAEMSSKHTECALDKYVEEVCEEISKMLLEAPQEHKIVANQKLSALLTRIK